MTNLKDFKGLELKDVSYREGRISFNFEMNPDDERYGVVFATIRPSFHIKAEKVLELVMGID